MTLDCPFCNPLQSRVISVRSCYLTSYGYLSFCRFSNSTRSACKFPSCVQLVLLRSSELHPSHMRSCSVARFRPSCGILWSFGVGSRCSSPAGARCLELNGTVTSWCLGTLNFLWSASVFSAFQGSFRILGLHLGDHCLGSENFLSFPRLSQSNFFISISAAESGDIWGPGFLPHWYHPFWL